MTSRRVAPHILVVEDDREIRESLVELLEHAGYSASAAENGARALRAIEHAPRKPDVILLDLMMPDMNGFEFRAQQLARPEAAEIPIVVSTASDEAKADAEAIGAAGYVQKPFRIETVLALVERVLSETSREE